MADAPKKVAKKPQRLPKPGRAVLVRWHDIATDHGWEDSGLKPATCVSVGIVYRIEEHDGKKALLLVGMHGTSQAGDIETNSRHTVPAGCITSWAYLVEEPAVLSVKIPLTSAEKPATVGE